MAADAKLELIHVTKRYGETTAVDRIALRIAAGSYCCLLGPSGCGKTSTLRMIAGHEIASEGDILLGDRNITGLPAAERGTAMMFQSYALFPHLSALDNVAFSLKMRGVAKADRQKKAAELLDRVSLGALAHRKPAELSGGQQQRVALARALAKKAPLMLLDEPLVNLDYKLREELREELSQLFATGESTVVYATTEPTEALLLGGYTAVLDGGELLQYGPTAEVFRRPKSMRVARAFSDPPMNLLAGTAATLGVTLPAGVNLSVPLPAASSSALTIGIRASALRVHGRDGDLALPGSVELAEISGSDTFVHVDTPVGELVAQLTGVHQFELGSSVTLYLNPAQVYVFDSAGELLVAPSQGAA